LPIQKLPESTPSGYISQPPTSKSTRPGYHQIGEVPAIPLHPFWRKKIPFRPNGTVLIAKRELAINNEMRTRGNILPFMKNEYDSAHCIELEGKIKQNPFTKGKAIVLYNYYVQMYIFDLSIYGLHIAPTWYGLSYAIGFTICYFFIKRFFIFRDTSHIDTLLSFVFFGIILG
jgi:hypothetical protein